MKVKIVLTKAKIDEADLTVDEVIALEGGDAPMAATRDLLARFAVGEDGAYLPTAAAKRLLGRLTMTELRGALKEFWGGLRDAQVPPETGGSS